MGDVCGVSLLVSARRPSHVAWLITSIVVLAVQCQSLGWAQPNVGKESSEARTPAVTHSDATRSVVPILRVLRVMAPLNDGLPEPVFSSGTSPVSGGLLLRQASTRGRQATSETLKEDYALNSTRTPAPHAPHTMTAWFFSDHCPSSERLRQHNGTKYSRMFAGRVAIRQT